MAALAVDGARVEYGRVVAVGGLTLTVDAGELVVLLGLNGAGKSSLMKGIAGLVPLTAGDIRLAGRSVGAFSCERRVRGGLGYLPEGRGIFPSLSVEQNILIGAPRRAEYQRTLDAAFALFPALTDRRTQVAGSLSGGEQQMLALCRCLGPGPKVLLLDEPSLGLAPLIVRQLFETIRTLRDGGMAVLLVEQFAHAALRIADRAGVIVRGEMVRLGPAQDLARLTPAELAREYFGTSDADVPRGH